MKMQVEAIWFQDVLFPSVAASLGGYAPFIGCAHSAGTCNPALVVVSVFSMVTNMKYSHWWFKSLLLDQQFQNHNSDPTRFKSLLLDLQF